MKKIQSSMFIHRRVSKAKRMLQQNWAGMVVALRGIAAIFSNFLN
jgi:hypothetical protein